MYNRHLSNHWGGELILYNYLAHITHLYPSLFVLQQTLCHAQP